MKSKKDLLLTAVIFLAFCCAAFAGDIEGKVTAQGVRSPENIVVYIESVSGTPPPPPQQHAQIDQRKMTFIPHVEAVDKGATVDFLNSDPVGHNVYWPSVGGNKKLAHNLGTWPQGQKKSFTFEEVGAVPLLCNVHPEMSGYIFVAPTPYFAVTNSQGQYVIKNVPPGHYTLKTWSEEGKPTEQPIDVSAGPTTANLTVHK